MDFEIIDLEPNTTIVLVKQQILIVIEIILLEVEYEVFIVIASFRKTKLVSKLDFCKNFFIELGKKILVQVNLLIVFNEIT